METEVQGPTPVGKDASFCYNFPENRNKCRGEHAGGMQGSFLNEPGRLHGSLFSLQMPAAYNKSSRMSETYTASSNEAARYIVKRLVSEKHLTNFIISSKMELSMLAHLQFYLSNPLLSMQRVSEPHPILGFYIYR